MATTNVNIRMDESLKRQFELFCEEVGMSMTTAFCIFAKKAVRENRIPFEVGVGTPNEETIEALREVEEMKKNPNYGKKYTNVDEMMKELLA